METRFVGPHFLASIWDRLSGAFKGVSAVAPAQLEGACGEWLAKSISVPTLCTLLRGLFAKRKASFVCLIKFRADFSSCRKCGVTPKNYLLYLQSEFLWILRGFSFAVWSHQKRRKVSSNFTDFHFVLKQWSLLFEVRMQFVVIDLEWLYLRLWLQPDQSRLPFFDAPSVMSVLILLPDRQYQSPRTLEGSTLGALPIVMIHRSENYLLSSLRFLSLKTLSLSWSY